MPSLVADAAATWVFGGASESASRTLPVADAILLVMTMFDGTGDTLAATIVGQPPNASYQGNGAASDPIYVAVFVAAPPGSQTVDVSGGDAGDGWCVGVKGVNDIDALNPFDGQVTDSASPSSIDVATTVDGLAVGGIQSDTIALTTSDTEVFEQDRGAPTICLGVAATAGTGGTASLDWSGGGTHYVSVAVNLRHTPDVIEPIYRQNRSSVPPNVRMG